MKEGAEVKHRLTHRLTLQQLTHRLTALAHRIGSLRRPLRLSLHMLGSLHQLTDY